MAMYIRYCYILGAIPSRKSHTSVSPQMKKELLKMNRISERTRYLCQHHIVTKDDLQRHMCDLSSALDEHIKQRAALRQQQRTIAVKGDCVTYEANKKKMSALSSCCYSIRKELRLCTEIEQDAPAVAEQIKAEEQRKKHMKSKAQRRSMLR